MRITADDLIGFLRDELGYAVPDVDPDTSLFGSGVVDSFALVSLIAYVEQRCSFGVRPTDVTLDNWDTIRGILDYIERRTGAAGSAGGDG